MQPEEMRAARIAEIGRRANALKRAGFYNKEEVAWLAGHVRQPQVQLIEIELLLTNAEGFIGLKAPRESTT